MLHHYWREREEHSPCELCLWNNIAFGNHQKRSHGQISREIPSGVNYIIFWCMGMFRLWPRVLNTPWDRVETSLGRCRGTVYISCMDLCPSGMRRNIYPEEHKMYTDNTRSHTHMNTNTNTHTLDNVPMDKLCCSSSIAWSRWSLHFVKTCSPLIHWEICLWCQTNSTLRVRVTETAGKTNSWSTGTRWGVIDHSQKDPSGYGQCGSVCVCVCVCLCLCAGPSSVWGESVCRWWVGL